jgi:hypothetical protein
MWGRKDNLTVAGAVGEPAAAPAKAK